MTPLLLLLAPLALVHAQQVGNYTAETHPRLPWQRCTRSGGCQTQSAGQVVLDSNWRWLHRTGNYTNCYTGNTWNTTVCTNGRTCAQNCALEGADYRATYGITVSGNALTLKFVTESTQKNVGSRVYLMASETRYEMFKLLNQEFTFDVDVSQLPCGINGALYFSEMEADGGMGRFPANKAGAKYGTGYCDSQCARDIKFINGEANVEGWTPSESDPNAGTGNWGSCCGEMDIWEANSISTAYTPHPCREPGLYRCSGTACGGPSNRYGHECDPDGCDFNSYRMGDRSFYGKGMKVDTSKKITVVTQFYTNNNSSSGTLREIRRVYVQDGRVIQNSKVNIPGMDSNQDSITETFCRTARTAFEDPDSFNDKGGMAGMSRALAAGMVLVLSIWDDHFAHMLWLDSQYPVEADPEKPGVARGTCPTSGGVPSEVERNSPNAQVIYSNIKFGDIGSTYSGSS